MWALFIVRVQSRARFGRKPTEILVPKPPKSSSSHKPPRAASRPRPERRPSRPEDGPQRLQKLLASAGLGSRRSCEELILQGRVSVDGQVIRELGTKVAPSAKILVDGQPVRRERHVYLALHKPKGYVSTNNDPAGRPRVVDLVSDLPERVYSVGRLDEDSTGLMILTNDGDLANKLAHPRFGVEKVYRVLVAGRPDHAAIEALLQGVWLSDGKARARRARIIGEQGDATLVEMVLAEGKNREVRRMWAKLGHKVMRLTRVAIGPVSIKDLRLGHWRHLTGFEVTQLQKLARGEAIETAQFRPPADRPPQRPRRGPARHASEAATSRRPESGDALPPAMPRIYNADQVPPPSQRRRSQASPTASRPPRKPPRAGRPPAPRANDHEIEVDPSNLGNVPPRRPGRSAPPAGSGPRGRVIIGGGAGPRRQPVDGPERPRRKSSLKRPPKRRPPGPGSGS